MVDFNSIIKLINTNNDKIIQKSEVETYLKQQKNESIFTGYFASIDSDVEVKTFKRELKRIDKEFKLYEKKEARADKKYFKSEGYFDYQNRKPEPEVAKSLDDIRVGSHPGIKDARGYDISSLKLTKEELLNLCIDKTTILSDEQRAIIDEYTEKMKDPGLGIRALHEQGFTGKGVKMAIIDQPLGEHQEYSSNIAEHNDVNATEVGWTKASMHGAAVTSIAVGKNTGVAPEASVNYYSAVNLSTDPKDIEFYRANLLKEIENNKEIDGMERYLAYLKEQLETCDSKKGVLSNRSYVDAINQILDKNEKLPKKERVSVVSISWGFDRFAPGYEELQEALARAKEQGVFIISTAIDQHYTFKDQQGNILPMETTGANRNPQADPNDPKSYEAGAFWKGEKFAENENNLLLVPMDHRTVADFTDDNSYRYEGNDGGMSWSTPWLAGIYVLAKQANPNITPEEFWKVALETSDECRNNDDNAYVGRMINPQKIIETIRFK